NHGIRPEQIAAAAHVGLEEELDPRTAPRVGAAERPAAARAQRGPRDAVEPGQDGDAEIVVALAHEIAERVVRAAAAPDEDQSAPAALLARGGPWGSGVARQAARGIGGGEPEAGETAALAPAGADRAHVAALPVGAHADAAVGRTLEAEPQR